MKLTLSNPWTIITFSLVLPVTVYSAMKWYDVFFKQPPSFGTIQQTSLDRFSDQHNLPADDILKGKLTVVNFFFTSCPVICPKMMKNVKQAHDQFAGDSDVNFVSITVDPERDTQKRLQWYIQKMGINEQAWHLIRGSKPDTYLLARNQFNLVAADATNDNSDFIHSDKLILIDAAGNIRGYYSGLQKSAIDQLITDIKKIKS